MPTASQTTPSRSHAAQRPHRSLDLITGPLSEISRRSASLTVCEPGRFEFAAAAHFLPRNQGGVIDGFRARDGIIRAGYEGVLRAPPGVKPRPFEVILETPHHAPQYLQEAALAVALHTILEEYRKFIAYAQNL